jgi:hypothetical protein
MNDHDEMNDDVLVAVRDSLSRVPMPAPIPLAAIVARGRSGRYRRRSALAAVGVAAAVAVAVGLPAIAHVGSTPPPARSGSGRLSATPVHVHLAAFSVDSNQGGTVTVTLTWAQVFDPNTMRQVLAQAGVPALITVGSACYSPGEPAGPAVELEGIVSAYRRADGTEVMVINPSAIPTGKELSIGYVGNDHIALFALVPEGATLTCHPALPSPSSAS